MGKKSRQKLKTQTIILETVTTMNAGSPLCSSKTLLAAFFLVFSIAIVYFPSLKVPFLLDDNAKIVRNPDIKSLDNIPSRLIYPYEQPPTFYRNDPSRPLTYLTLTLNYYFNHLDPYGYHVFNIVLHATVTLLVFLLGLLIFPMIGISGITLPFLSALFFGIHPINVNVVSYIMGRAASLATVFYLFAVILFIRAKSGMKWGIPASAICLVFALASNQLAITLPAIMLVTDFCYFSERNVKRLAQNWKQHATYWWLLAIYVAVRFAYFGRLGDIEATSQVLDRTKYFLTQLTVLWKYIGMVMMPSGLSIDHAFVLLEYVNDPRFLAAIGLFGMLYLGLFYGIKTAWRQATLILFSTLWFFITISPTSSIFPTTTAIAENRVYLPLAGLCLIIPFIIDVFIRGLISDAAREVLLIGAFGIYASLLGGLTLQRNILYQDPISMWKDVIERYPDHVRAYNNLAVEYSHRRQFDKAVEANEKGLAINPNDLNTRNNLAVLYYKMNRYQQALEQFQKVITERPNFAPGYLNMGLVYERLKNTSAAINAYQTAIRLNPMLAEALNNLGSVYFESGHTKEALSMYEAALRIDPHNPAFLKNYQRVSSGNLNLKH